MRNLIPILLLLALSGNLLVPIHSDWFFGSLALNSAGSTEYSLFNFDIFGVVLRKIFLLFGEKGVGALQIITFFLIAVLLYLNFIVIRNVDKEKDDIDFDIRFILGVLAQGVFQYGQDLHPVHLILVYILLSRLSFNYENEGVFWFYFIEVCFSFLIILGTFMDARIIFAPFVCVILLRQDKLRNFKRVLLSFLPLVLISVFVPQYRRFLKYQFSNLLEFNTYEETFEMIFASVGEGLTFDFGFLFLLLAIYLVRHGFTCKFLILILFIPLAFVSYLIKITIALIVMERIIDSNSKENLRYLSLKKSLNNLRLGLSKISYEGRVFLIASLIFVSTVSFIKNPITDQLFPVKQVDMLVEEGQCPEFFDPQIRGYLRFRFAHLSQCEDILAVQGASKKQDIDRTLLKGHHTSSFPDRWR